MISQRAMEKISFASGQWRSLTSNSDKILETHTENLLRMVSYCVNDVDCRHLLRLVHFGEKFDLGKCSRTCDNCSKSLQYAEKDVTETANQLVELIRSTGQQYSSSNILEVYKGSIHDSLNLHGAGKHLAKGEASRILCHLVIEEVLAEKVEKSYLYGSVSSVLKVNEFKEPDHHCGGKKFIIRQHIYLVVDSSHLNSLNERGWDDDSIDSNSVSKKRATKNGSNNSEQCIDIDLDGTILKMKWMSRF
ncbi:Atp-dependent dna helicase q-like 4b [Thalictrum thalictroides]|uniref:Atp-dependent dna helicase q-like 4b n=1 Tax=Thalictrum thalictroides TaxID=46969 RepID=A0A7J6UXE9_THATH|nr:Atp-dependent dna helicase q-like 4b [Thalictrum thalictroides]